jgi:hypothetical protein
MTDQPKDPKLNPESDEDLDVRAEDGEGISGGRYMADESGDPDALRLRGKRRLEYPKASAARAHKR